MVAYLKALLLKSIDLSITLFKIMVPIIIVIKVLEELGFIIVLSDALSPVMELVGLPGAMGLVWATTLVTSIYGGMVVFAALIVETPMTLAQVTVVSGMMLMAHSLPIELRVAQKVGVRIGFTLVLRVTMAILFAYLLNMMYIAGSWLQQPVELLWTPTITTLSLSEWVLDQLLSLALIFVIVFALVLVLDVLERLKIIQGSLLQNSVIK